MNFFCVYCRTRKKFDKFVKVNKIRNKYILDVRKMMEEEELKRTEDDKQLLKILIFKKIQLAIEKGKDVYFIPEFNAEFSIEKLLNLRKILEDNNFNILLFYDEFQKQPEVISEALENLSKFSNSQIIRDY